MLIEIYNGFWVDPNTVIAVCYHKSTWADNASYSITVKLNGTKPNDLCITDYDKWITSEDKARKITESIIERVNKARNNTR